MRVNRLRLGKTDSGPYLSEYVKYQRNIKSRAFLVLRPPGRMSGWPGMLHLLLLQKISCTQQVISVNHTHWCGYNIPLETT